MDSTSEEGLVGLHQNDMESFGLHSTGAEMENQADRICVCSSVCVQAQVRSI